MSSIGLVIFLAFIICGEILKYLYEEIYSFADTICIGICCNRAAASGIHTAWPEANDKNVSIKTLTEDARADLQS